MSEHKITFYKLDKSVNLGSGVKVILPPEELAVRKRAVLRVSADPPGVVTLKDACSFKRGTVVGPLSRNKSISQNGTPFDGIPDWFCLVKDDGILHTYIQEARSGSGSAGNTAFMSRETVMLQKILVALGEANKHLSNMSRGFECLKLDESEVTNESNEPKEPKESDGLKVMKKARSGK